ncbi:MAG TPA: UDP-3-O-(3-hydroxymyristoyl)glucosamine N-acyltransferase [Nitrospiraceae bacterium]|nr:UDP-3-O-(3-hydroxymyristoyl)glucosamine N-acyltransferase [Nitrospiraceae bacterium]
MPESASRPLQLVDIQRAIGGELVGRADTVVSGASSLEEAGPGDLAYIAADRFIPAAQKSKAAAFVVSGRIRELNRPQIVVPNPAYAFACLVEQFFTAPLARRGIAEQVARGTGVSIGPDASIWPLVTLGDRVRLGARVTLFPGVFIGDDAVVGDDTVLYPNVTVMDRCVVGCRVKVHSGTVIGSDGFGYVQHEGRHRKVPQLGIVVIEDDVELGANVTVDRATFGRTVIKRGTKVDNLVQIAHNVSVGEDAILVAQVGIAGSTTLGRSVMVGGQAGIADHIQVGDRVMIAARSGVSRNLEGGQIVAGSPAIPHGVALKAYNLIGHLPELRQQLRDLEQRVRALESSARRTGRKKRPGKRRE